MRQVSIVHIKPMKMMNKLIAIGFMFGFMVLDANAARKLPRNVNKSEHWTVSATYYNPVREQCDDNPLEVATGDLIDMRKLKRGDLKWIAVSRDLLKFGFKLNEVVWIEELECFYIIKDTMNARFTRKVDVLQHASHKPLKYSKLTLRKLIR